MDKDDRRAFSHIEIYWILPPKNGFKLNSYSLMKKEIYKAGCRGLLRDYNGKWLTGFYEKLKVLHCVCG